MLEKCVLTILELNWNQRLGHKKAKLNICHHMLTSSTQLQNRSFHVVERTRTSTKCQKIEKCTCKACKNTVFHCQICKFVGSLLPSSSWLLKLPNSLMVWLFVIPPREGLLFTYFSPGTLSCFFFVTINNSTGVSRGSTRGEANDKCVTLMTLLRTHGP